MYEVESRVEREKIKSLLAVQTYLQTPCSAAATLAEAAEEVCTAAVGLLHPVRQGAGAKPCG